MSATGHNLAFAQFGGGFGLAPDHSEPCDPTTFVVEDDDEPKPPLVYIDPAQFVPEPLARPIDLDVTDLTLADAMHRISEATGLPVRIDEEELKHGGVKVDEIVSDRAENEPAYLLLDRLLHNVAGVELAWFVDHGLLHVTSKLVADDRMLTMTYNVRDLLELGYDDEKLVNVITNSASGPWFDLDGVGGTLEIFRDVLVVRQCHRMQREVAGLLDAIRARGRERRAIEPPSHAELERRLDQIVPVEFSETPLSEVVEQLNLEHGLRLQIDAGELQNEGVHPAVVVSLPTAKMPLRSVLHILLENVAGVELAAMLHKGRIQITTRLVADDHMSPIVYDVGDLTSHSECHMEPLMDLILTETSGPWFDTDGVGGNIVAMGDLMLITHTARVQSETARLLANLRTGMAESQQQGWKTDHQTKSEQTLATYYYKVDTDAADDLVTKIPELIEPGTWASTVDSEGESVQLAADGVGTIDRMASGRRVVAVTSDGRIFNSGSYEKTDSGKDGPQQAAVVVIPRTVLIITHRRSVHRKLVAKMREIELPGSTWSSDRDIGTGFTGGPDQVYQGGGFFSVRE